MTDDKGLMIDKKRRDRDSFLVSVVEKISGQGFSLAKQIVARPAVGGISLAMQP